MKLALVGYGSVGRALARLLHAQRSRHPFRITGIHTARHGTAVRAAGLPLEPEFGPAAPSVGKFLDDAAADILVELSPLNPATGQPAISHLRAAFERGMHAVTANKGPLAHAYAALREKAEQHGVQFRFEATVMDGVPLFSTVRNSLPAVRVLGFTGALNSTSKIVIDTMEGGGTLEEGLEAARALGITEGNGSFDVDGWDSAVKTAVLANVLMDARVTPQAVSARGITRLTPERVRAVADSGKTVRLISRARRTSAGLSLRVRAEVLPRDNVMAAVPGTSNILLLHTDLMGTIGSFSLNPTIDQTAYGVFADLMDAARHPRAQAVPAAAPGGLPPPAPPS